MDDNRTIRLVRREPKYSAVWVSDRFEFNAKGRLPWLQRLLFKVLRWLKADSFDTKVSYETVEVDTTKIVSALLENQRDVEMLYYKKARYVVMGAIDFARFSTGPEFYQMTRFEFATTVGRGRTMLNMNLEVVVVPWIEGFFVLPDLTTVS